MRLPSVLLHDHLDGGLRPSTVIDLASASGYDGLPTEDVGELAAWFDQSESGSLERYLGAFEHTIGVMQTADALERVAYEAVVDLTDQGVVYAEIRFCPALHVERGLEPRRVVEAVASGMSSGASETRLRWGLIIDGLRQMADSMAMARLAAQCRSLGVVGFDIAGPEADNPPRDHVAAFRHAREEGLRVTAHAGESAGARGVSYIAQAMDVCSVERIGHGIELIADCVLEDGEVVKLGRVSSRVRDRQLPLEMCPASNLATAGIEAPEHPIGAMHRAGFNVTINTDNRLMSNTSMPAEFGFVIDHHGFGIDDLASITRRSLQAAFCDHETKVELWEDVIAPAYVDAGADPERSWTC